MLRSYVAGGGSLVVTFETSLYDSAGVRREDFLLADCLGTHYRGETRSSMASPEEGYKQVYMSIEHPHPILVGTTGATVLPMGGPVAVVDVAPDVDVPLRLSAPFVVFPEGFSYPTIPAGESPWRLSRSTMAADDPFTSREHLGRWPGPCPIRTCEIWSPTLFVGQPVMCFHFGSTGQRLSRSRCALSLGDISYI